MNNHGIFHNFEIFEIMKVNVAWDRTSIKVHGDWRSQLKGRRWDEWVAERGNKKKKWGTSINYMQFQLKIKWGYNLTKMV